MSNCLSMYYPFSTRVWTFHPKKGKESRKWEKSFFFAFWVTVGVDTNHNLCFVKLKKVLLAKNKKKLNKYLLHSSSIHPPPYGNRAQTDLLFFLYISYHQTINNDQVDPNLSYLVHLFSGKLDLALLVFVFLTIQSFFSQSLSTCPQENLHTQTQNPASTFQLTSSNMA